jgi:YHS domain-containing protein/uncharacterized membrane protein YraQ (UPF0718 family)
MSITEGPFLRRLFSGRAFTAISHYFFMDLASLYQDLIIGFLAAGAIAAWVPDSFWRAFFLTDHPALAQLWGPVIGPFISMISFVCSVGNVPLAAVLWNGGISFGGVIAFIFADLIIIPIINIYRKYYGLRMSLYLLGVSYAAMALAGLIIGLLFTATGLVPAHHRVQILQSRPEWNYTTFLDLAFIVLALALGYRFLTTGGPAMLRAMEAPAGDAGVATDPVCGMSVDPATATEKSTYNGRDYYFCSPGCREEFEGHPDQYAEKVQVPARHH